MAITHASRTRLLGLPAVAALALLLAPAGATAAPGAVAQLPEPHGCHLPYPIGIAPCGGAQGLGLVSSVVVSPNGKRVYVASRGNVQDPSDAVGVFTRLAGTGRLIQQGGATACVSQQGSGDPDCTSAKALKDPRGIAISPDGKNLYAASYGSNGVAAFKIHTLGSLSQLPGQNGCITKVVIIVLGQTPPCRTGSKLSRPVALAISPDNNGKFVYVASSTSPGGVSVLRRTTSGAETGRLKYESCAASSNCATTSYGIGSPEALAVSPDGHQLYVGGNGALAVFNRNAVTGKLTQLPAPEGCVGSQPGCKPGNSILNTINDLAISPDGKNVYVTSNGGPSGEPSVGTLGILSRNPATGTLTPLGCIQDTAIPPCADGVALAGTKSVTVSPDGLNVYVTSVFGTNHAVATFSRDPGTGQLSQLPGFDGCLGALGCRKAPYLGLPTVAAVSPDGKNVYVGGARISGFQGSLTSFSPYTGAPPTCLDKTVQNTGGSGADIQLECNDPGNQPLTYSIVTPSNLAAVTIDQATGIAYYSPNSSFVGPDSFTFKASNGIDDSNVATVTVNNVAG